jgi:hypothetical protein
MKTWMKQPVHQEISEKDFSIQFLSIWTDLISILFLVAKEQIICLKNIGYQKMQNH